ncbi:endolytic transglycosylase MltG [Aureisphaera galaxeae]|uniref:endolytic transglycosylase MltG n=1 Tax=Aureisphaera galaxeae TaxID=1538023 RepID=UPI002350785B|nr:endolytic transglycosylase MltG [Aureisphaera galaxeae]MDC8003865.1 endolytic transglycosylase MltG [Aureisphaera galaxeae]
MRKKMLWGILIVGVIGGVFAYHKYTKIMAPNVPDTLENNMVYIPTNSSFSDVVEALYTNYQIIDTVSFREVSEMMKYKKSIMRAGRYKITPSWSNRALIGHLRAGNQEPIKLVLTHGWLLEDVAEKAAQFIEADSTDLVQLFYNEDYIKKSGYTTETLMSLFIPNTYELYWNTDERAFFERMVTEHERFWNTNDRLSKAEKLGMTPTEVYTLASIVEREISKDSEKKRVAGLYLNRIKIGMKLDADPTAKFATRDFKATRILYKHIRFESPYNTYLHKGLPPGPISMASIKSIDAVLDSEKHNFYYMCVDPDKPGYHLFAESITEHNRNARRYHRWLDNLEKRKKQQP